MSDPTESILPRADSPSRDARCGSRGLQGKGGRRTGHWSMTYIVVEGTSHLTRKKACTAIPLLVWTARAVTAEMYQASVASTCINDFHCVFTLIVRSYMHFTASCRRFDSVLDKRIIFAQQPVHLLPCHRHAARRVVRNHALLT